MNPMEPTHRRRRRISAPARSAAIASGPLDATATLRRRVRRMTMLSETLLAVEWI